MFLGKLIALSMVICGVRGLVGCVGEDGGPVDYFYVLKANKGNTTYYLEGDDEVLTKTKTGMGGSEGAVPMTLSQVYKKLPSSYAYAMYNDQSPDGKGSTTYAHAKGVVFFDGTQGFWLLHSLPRYPAYREDGYDGLPDDTYGQSFVCITLSAEHLDTIGVQLQVYRPYIYDSGTSSDMEKDYPEFAAALDGTKSDADTSVEDLETVGGMSFTHFAKSTKCACELYEDVVAPKLKVGLLVETWMNGAIKNKIPTSCKEDGFKYDVQDIETVEMSDGASWRETQDHSKWAVSSSSTFVCVGGVNRQYSQAKRGGGTLCLKKESAWKAFDAIVANISDPCQ